MSFLSAIAGLFSRAPRRVAADALGRRPIRARYDAAQTHDANTRHWGATDALDADAANSKVVRQTIAQRARYETENNGHGKGVVLTHANYVVGRGPRLRMLTGSTGMNAMVESAWKKWSKAVKLGRKLRTAVKAKTRDGEAFLVAKQNPNLRDKIKMDLVGIECEQCTTPLLTTGEPWKIDGIEFDEFGNPEVYSILKQHPGSEWLLANTEPDRIPAKFVLHLFREDRPGQHRAVSELSATLGLFSAGRRWREATVTAAENAAEFSMMMKTNSSPDEVSEVPAFDTMEINRGMLTALPYGYELAQLKAEHPTASYGEFNRSLMCEEARPLNMPYNIAAADSSDYSFSGGRLDHLTYFVSVDVDQSDCEDMVLDPLFDLWWEEAVLANEWTLDTETSPAHEWVWPAKPQIDDQKTASARQTALATGCTSLRRIYNEDGLDLDDAIAEMAEDYGVSEDKIRRKLYEVNFQRPSVAPANNDNRRGNAGDDDSSDDDEPKRNGKPVNRLPSRNGNGRQPAGADR